MDVLKWMIVLTCLNSKSWIPLPMRKQKTIGCPSPRSKSRIIFENFKK